MENYNITSDEIDILKVMILIKGVDKTDEIRTMEYNEKTGRVDIIYKNSQKGYSTNCNDIELLYNPVRQEIGTKEVYKDDIYVYDASYLLCFGTKTRIVTRNGHYISDDSDKIVLIESALNNQDVAQIMDYFRDISQHIPVEKNSEYDKPFLYHAMERLTFIHPESILAAYLQQAPIKRRRLEKDGFIFPFQFNLSQKAALQNALTHSISVIQGPPGTGKTQTILNILANLITLQHKSVAVVSNNNDAVENVIEKLTANEYGFLTALLGNKDNREVFFQNISAPDIPEQWRGSYTMQGFLERIKKLDKKLTFLQKKEREKKQKEQELKEWCLEQEYFEHYYAKQEVEKSVKLPLFCKSPNKIMSFLAETAMAKEYKQYQKRIYKFKMLIKYGVFDIRKLEKEEIDVVLKIQREFYQLQIKKLKKEIGLLDKQLKGASFEQLIEEYQHYSEGAFRRSLYMSNQSNIASDFTYKDYKARFKEFEKRFPIIFSTTYSLRSSIPGNYLLDYVIIDEASQVDLITGVLVLSCCRNVVIVGDTKQLPQIVDKSIKKQIEMQDINPVYDYFAENILSSILKLYGSNVPCITLREHYRCLPQIIEFCNKQYYDGELIVYTKPDESIAPLLLYKTAEGNHMRELTYDKKKKVYNQRELDVIVGEVLKNPEVENQETIGFVTPFRKQVEKAEGVLDYEIQCDTVHKYQGREKDIMIMSTVLDKTYAGVKRLEFVDDPQLVNVAVSRAVKQFILVTDKELFFSKGKNISALIKYIQYSTLDENVIESQIVSVFDLLYKKYSSKLLRLKEKMNPDARWKSEEALRVLLEEILKQPKYDMYTYAPGVLIKNIINDDSMLEPEEKRFVNNRASVDFLIFNKMDKKSVLVIEVDGFAFHENNPIQQGRDELKDTILEKIGIKVLRLPTNGSGEREKIEELLNKI